jgi:hypothetical protein
MMLPLHSAPPAVIVDPKSDYSDQALAHIRASGAAGMNADELGAAIYGSDDERGSDKSRALVHHLQRKRNEPVVRDERGRWVYQPSERR